MNSINRTARLAGLLYLMNVPLGIFGTLYVPSRLIVSGDAATTASNIVAFELLFRLGIVSNLLAVIVMMLVVLTLYRLLKPVNKTIALLMVTFVLVGASISMLNKLNQFAVLFLSGADYSTVFTTEQLQALVDLFLGLHNRGSNIAFIFWGLWLFPLGYLVFKSGFLPRILGVLLMIACCGYVIDSFAILLGSGMGISMFVALGEILFLLWLLIKGVNAEQWEKRALESARSSPCR